MYVYLSPVPCPNQALWISLPLFTSDATSDNPRGVTERGAWVAHRSSSSDTHLSVDPLGKTA